MSKAESDSAPARGPSKTFARKKCSRSWGGYLGQKKSREEDCRVFRERFAVQASLYSRFFQQPLGAYPGIHRCEPKSSGKS